MRGFWSGDAGATAVEYALLLAIVGAAVAASALYLGGVIGGEMNETAVCISGSSC